MTASSLVTRTDNLYPNVFPFPMKVRWLFKLDSEIVREFLSRFPSAPEVDEAEMQNADRELILGEEHSDIYINYLIMKMELHSGNISGYVNAAALYNSTYLSFMEHYTRTHQIEGAKINID